MNFLDWLRSVNEQSDALPLVLFLVKITLLLGMAWGIHWALAAANPRWRALVWRTAAIGLVVLGVLSLSPQVLHLEWLPGGIEEEVTPIVAEAQTAMVEVPSDPSMPAPQREFRSTRTEKNPPRRTEPQRTIEPAKPFDVVLPRSPDVADVASSKTSATPEVTVVIEESRHESSDSEPTPSIAASRSEPEVKSSEFRWTWRKGLITIWVFGLLLFGGTATLAWLRLGGILRDSAPVPDRVAQEVQSFALKFPAIHRCRVYQTRRITSPCLCSVFRPILLLPEELGGEDNQNRLQAILRHEMAHLENRDVVWNLILHMLTILLWFHPLAWGIRKAHAAACDSVADSLTATYLGDVNGYCRLLARMALEVHHAVNPVALAMARTSDVRQRIESLKRQVFSTELSRRRVNVVRGLAILAIVAFAEMTLVAGPGEVQNNPMAAKKVEEAAAEINEAAEEPKPEQSHLLVSLLEKTTQKRLAKATVQFSGRIGSKPFRALLDSDENGVVTISWPKGDTIQNLWMTASKQGFVPIHYTWQSDQKPIEMPARLDLEFEAGKTIGGIIHDEGGKPIENAEIRLSMPITWPKLANYAFTPATVYSDKQGQWKWDSAPSNIRVGSRVTHPDYLLNYGNSNEKLDAVTVLKKGLEVRGRVVDTNGHPVPDAVARLGFDVFGTDEPTAKTDAEGRFVLKNCEPGQSAVTIQAENYAPEFQKITVNEKTPAVEFILQIGYVLKGQVVDVKGEPVAGVMVAPDTWLGMRTLQLQMRTDENGRFEWRGAPEEPVQYDFLKQGYMSKRRQVLKSSPEDQKIELSPLLIIHGKVTDAETKQPIPQFEIRAGAIYHPQNDISWSRDPNVPFKNGEYRIQFDEPVHGRVLEILAKGYLPTMSRTFQSEEGTQSYDVKLTTGSGPTGTVVLPDGKPADGAEVALARRDRRADLRGGHFSRDQEAEVVKTSLDGQFSFPSQGDEPFLLIAVHEAGYAEVTRENFEKDTQLKLRPWGKIQGTVRVGKEPDQSREVSYRPKSNDRDSFLYIWQFGYEVHTDAQGEFQFDRVIPGPGTISRVVITEFLDSWQHSPCWQQKIEVKPTETTEVTIGGTGRPVKGQVKLDREPDVPVDWTKNEPATVVRWNRKTNTRTTDYARYAAPIDTHGRFQIPDVPAGDYQLDLPVNNPPSPNSCGPGTVIGKATLVFTVPDIPEGQSDEPFDLGSITAVLSDTLDPGELAPDFAAEKTTGGMLRLGELHGKLVVLDFWATWCAPCLAEMPTFQEIQREFGGDRRFALVGLSCDAEIETVKKFAEEKNLNWLQAHIKSMQSQVVQDYTVRALPGTFLIGPDGRVLAKNLRGKELKKAIEAALKNEELFKAAATTARPARYPVIRFAADAEEPDLKPETAVLMLVRTERPSKADQAPKAQLRFLSQDGKTLKEIDGVDWWGSVGAVHTVAVDPERNRIYVSENGTNQITAFDFRGQKLWTIQKVSSDVLAVDPKTGNVWSSGGRQLDVGETVVFDAEGRELASFPYRAVDMIYDPHTEAFWLVGYAIQKLDRQGKILFEKRLEGWCCSSVSVNPRNGEVWIGERDHPDIAHSRNRIWHLDKTGEVLRAVELGKQDVFVVECDPSTGGAMFGGHQAPLYKVTTQGDVVELSKRQAPAISRSLTTGILWFGDKGGVFQIDEGMQEVKKVEFNQPFERIWLLAI